MRRGEAWTDLAILAEEGLQISRSGRGGEAADPEIPASPCCNISSSSSCIDSRLEVSKHVLGVEEQKLRENLIPTLFVFCLRVGLFLLRTRDKGKITINTENASDQFQKHVYVHTYVFYSNVPNLSD